MEIFNRRSNHLDYKFMAVLAAIVFVVPIESASRCFILTRIAKCIIFLIGHLSGSNTCMNLLREPNRENFGCINPSMFVISLL